MKKILLLGAFLVTSLVNAQTAQNLSAGSFDVQFANASYTNQQTFTTTAAGVPARIDLRLKTANAGESVSFTISFHTMTTPFVIGSSALITSAPVTVSGNTYATYSFYFNTTANINANNKYAFAENLPSGGVSVLADANVNDVYAGGNAFRNFNTEINPDLYFKVFFDSDPIYISGLALKVITDYAASNTNPTPTLANYNAAGVTGVTSSNLAAVNAAIDAADPAPTTLAQVQAIVNALNAPMALAEIVNYGNGTSTVPPTVDTYTTAGVTGVDSTTLAAVNAAIDAADPAPTNLTEIQMIVNAVNTALAASNAVLAQIGSQADDTMTASTVTLAQLQSVTPALTGVDTAPFDIATFNAYVDANPDLFSAPATPEQVQMAVTAVINAANASNAVLAQIGTQADDTMTASTVTLAQLQSVTPALTGVDTAPFTIAAFNAYVDANPDAFGSPATPEQVQMAVTAVINAANASNVVLAQIGSQADDTMTASTVTVAQLQSVTPSLTGVDTAPFTIAAFNAYVDANPDAFGAPATPEQVQMAVTAVINAANASNAVLAQIGSQADDTMTASTVTVAQLQAIVPGINGLDSTTFDIATFNAYVDANPDLFSAPATPEQVQAAVDVVLSSDSFDVTNFRMYPNPVSNILTISNSEAIQNVTIYDITGKEMMNSNLNTFESQLDLTSFSNGLYLVKVSVNNNTKTFRVIKN
jgi:hypothetical protein